MNLTITGTQLDVVLLIVLVFTIIRGLKNGLVDTVMRFVLTILVLGGAWYISLPVSYLIQLPEVGIDTQLLVFIAPMLQRVIAFLGVFIVLIIAKNIIYMLISPFIKKIIDFFTIVKTADGILGALFNLAKNTLIASILLACLNLPLFTNGSQILQESKGAQLVMVAAPTISEQLVDFGKNIVDFTEVENWATKEFDSKDMIVVFDTMRDFGVLSADSLNQFYQDYAYEISMIPNAHVSEKEYNKLLEMIEQLPENESLKNILRHKISY